MPRHDMMMVGTYLEQLYAQLETRKGAELLAVELGIDLIFTTLPWVRSTKAVDLAPRCA